MYHNWQNNNKKLKFSDAKNTRKIDAFFSKCKASETQESVINENWIEAIEFRYSDRLCRAKRK